MVLHCSPCEGRTCFCMGLISRKLADSYFCFGLALLHSLSHFFFLYWSPSLSLCTVSDLISSNIDEILSISPSANVFVFGNFNIHHKDWLTDSGGNDRPGELCYNFSVSNDFTKMVNFHTRIPDSNSHSAILLDVFLSSDASICFTMTFPPLENSDHVAVSVLLTFHQIHNGMPCFIAWLRRLPFESFFSIIS